MNNIVLNLENAVSTGLFDQSVRSDDTLRPRLLYNDIHKGNNILVELEQNLLDCDSFWFSVAFITKSGLVVLKETLRELDKNNIKGHILTTDYLSFSEPDAFRELLRFSNLKVRVYTRENFHTKGYMFTKDGLRTFIVGSSNLTQGALKANKEWNLKITSLEQGKLIQETEDEFQVMWDQSVTLTEEWITDIYEPVYINRKKERKAQKIERIRTYTLEPNMMQREATKALINLRKENSKKAILISATGERVIIVTGCINALRSRVLGTLVNMIHALLRVIRV